METHSHEPINTNIDGETSENTFEEKREITHFTEDDRVLTDAVTEITSLPLSLLQYGDEPREHSVISFLQRPEKIATVTWTTAQTKTTNLVSLPIPSSVLTTMYREKLRGFGLLRADIVFKLQFNSQPFQAGRLIATYIPVPAYLLQRTRMARASLTRLTSLPNVIIDISKQTECNITLPYVSSFTHYDLTSGGGDWGLFDLWVYSPLSSASSQTINISIRAYLDNVRLGAPTQQSLVTAEKMLKANVQTRDLSRGTSSCGSISARAQGGKQTAGSGDGSFGSLLNKGTKSVTMQERSAGTISRVGHSIREGLVRGLNVVGEFIPGLSEITDTANSVAMGVLNTLAAFGLGKPKNLDKIAPRTLHAFSDFAQATGVDNGHILSLHGDNKVTVLPGFAGSNTDELSMTYLMQTLQYYDTHTISTTTAVGTQIAAYRVTPFRFDLDLAKTAQSFVSGSPLINFGQPNLQWYIGSNFKYWRGDIIMHLALVKTDYHSVRLKIVYDPMAQSAAAVTYDASEYCYSIVVDFRDKTDIYVRLPFISATPWKLVPPSTYTGYTPPPVNQQEGLSTYSGYVAVFVDNILQASSAVVSQSIEMVSEFCAASNLDMGFPHGGQNWIPISTVLNPGDPIQADVQSAFAADGILKTRTNMQENTLDIKNITGMAPRPLYDNITSYTTGEEVYSLRMLMKRFNWIASVPSGQASIALPNTVKTIDAAAPVSNPNQIVDIRTGPPYANNTVSDCALVDVVGALFAFRAGGFRWKAWDSGSELISAYLVPFGPYNTYGIPPSTFTNLISNTSVYELDSRQVKGSAEFATPFYHPCYTQVNSNFSYFTEGGEPDLYFHFTQPQTVTVVSRSNPGSEMNIAKSAGDDLNFGFLLGVPDCLPSQIVAGLLSRPSSQPNLPNSTPIS
uniref:Capsid polyprotein n=2 Tax=Homalodisca coagulata virus 1 TaxID=2170238 RepID=Q0H2D9_9VIRU|nr:capsid polyprotein [Homalodisca coagulata virus 1]